MGLSAWEQQALDSIEGRLADSDPKLASLLATFTRLASGERMLAREAIRAASWRATSRRRRKRCRWHVGAGRPTRKIRLGWQWAMLVLGLAVATTLAAVSLAANRDGSKGTCHTSGVAACAGQAPGQGSRTTAHTMPLGLMMPATAGSHPAPPPVPASGSPVQARASPSQSLLV